MKKISASVAFLLATVIIWAQESKDINIHVAEGSNEKWYASPWIWVLGAAIFIVLLVALTKTGKKE